MKGEIKPTTKAKYNQTFNLKKKLLVGPVHPTEKKKRMAAVFCG